MSWFVQLQGGALVGSACNAEVMQRWAPMLSAAPQCVQHLCSLNSCKFWGVSALGKFFVVSSCVTGSGVLVSSLGQQSCPCSAFY